MTSRRVKIFDLADTILSLQPYVPLGTAYEPYFNTFFFTLSTCINLTSHLDSLWKNYSESQECIPLVIPTWLIVSIYSLWWAAIVTWMSSDRVPVSIQMACLAALILRRLMHYLPPVISRLWRSCVSLYDSQPSFATPQPYNHQALPSEAHIRLVRLRGFLLWRDFQILAYPLNACPAYEAISYTWDDQEPACPIVVNGGRLLVTRNARQILSDFTPAFGQRMIWIDSICINQARDAESLAERAMQVGRMSEIYRRATAVRVWLSQPPVPEILLPGRVEVLSKESLTAWILAHLFGVSFPRSSPGIFTLIAWIWRVTRIFWLGTPTLSSGSLQHILSHEYWIRLWIVQELAFGRETTIHSGTLCITWQSISNFAHKLLPEDYKDEYRSGITASFTLNTFYDISLSDPVLRGLRQIKLITRLRSNISNGLPEDLLALLSLLLHTKARDPRDKIYGLLSLVQERRVGLQTCQSIRADYNSTTKALYTGLAEIYLTPNAVEFSPRILLYAGIGWPKTVGGLPSWVPDWTSISMAHTRAFAAAIFDLHWEASTRSNCQKAFSFQGNTLKIAGCHVIDTISAQTQVIDHDDDSRRWFHEICDVVEGQLRYIAKKDIDSLGQWSRCYRRCPGRWRGAIFRVLIGDIKSYWGEAPHQTKVTTFIRPDTFPIGTPGAGHENPQHADLRVGRKALEASYDLWLNLPYNRARYPKTFQKETPGHDLFVSLSRRKTQGLRFAISQTGRMCLVPPEAAVGDKLILSEHLPSPHLVRLMKDEKGYQLVGHCIALGLMGDRAWNHYNAARGVNPEGYNLEVCKKEVLTIY